MRDDHYQDHIPKEPQRIPHAENLLADEIQPLLFDLVKADKVDVVRNLIDQYRALPDSIRFAIQECAASFGSAAMFDLIVPFQKGQYPSESLKFAIRAMNTDLFRHLLSRSKDCDNHYSGFTYSGLLGDILRSDLEEIFKEWEKYTDIEFCQQGKTKVPPWIRYTAAYVINTTSGNTGRETLLITL